MKENENININCEDIDTSSKYNEDSQTNNYEKSTSLIIFSPIIKDTKKEEKNNKNEEKEMKIGNYLIKKTIGKGTFGKVKLGIYLPRHKKVAIKVLEKKRLKEEDDIIRLKREFEMLSQFNHPNVITVSEIFETNYAYFTVMELCEGGELFNYIVMNNVLSEEKSAFFYYQLINGLEYIHSLGIVHRDLKPENLLLTKDHILKIIDFGLSNYFKNDQIKLLETPCGSPCYASPEMLSGENYDGFKIDIWATGIILFAMLCGFLPFDDKDNNKLFKKILECKINFPKTLSHDSKDLLKRILVLDPEKRISIKEIKKHPFYIKGKELFEKNFTIYQVTSDDIIDSDDSSYLYDFKYINENSFINNLLFYESEKKSEKIINKLNNKELFSFKNIKERSSSCDFVNKKIYNDLEIKDKKNKKLKKLVDIEKRIKKMKKKNKKKKDKKDINNLIQKIRLLFEENNNEILSKNNLNYNHSITFQLKDIISFTENLIIKYKIEEELNKLNKQNLEKNNKFIKPNKKNKSENNTKKKFEKKMEKNNKIKKSKEIINEKDKTNESLNILNNRKTININKKINFHNFNFLNNKNNKIKKKESTKINKLFINNNKIIKINKLKNANKFQKERRKIRSTSNNNSNKKKLKNILNLIKEHSLKGNINLINKQNIIHHHITNITNMTQKNYFSNVIINNYKYKDEKKLNYTCKNKSKIFFESPNFKIDKNLNIREYLQKNNVSNYSQMKKYKLKNWKFKTSLQKKIFKDDNLLKNSLKFNPKQITYNNTDEERKNQNSSIMKNKNPKKISKEKDSKTIPNTNNKNKKQYKIKVSYINNLINNKDYNKILNLNLDSSTQQYTTNKDKLFDSKDLILKYPLYNIDKNYKRLLTDINVDDEFGSKNKINYMNSSENSFTNRSNKKNMLNSFDKNKINYILNKNLNMPNFKKIENIKKYSINFKNSINFKKYKKLNNKDVNTMNKTEQNSIINQTQINSKRNKHLGASARKYKGTFNYFDSARINDKKLINTSCNFSNMQYSGNLTENSNTNFYSNHIFRLIKFKTSQNNLRNKNLLNNFNHLNKKIMGNITNENIKTDKNYLKNKSLLNNNELNSINNRLTSKNMSKYRHNTNIYFDKYIESKKLLASLRKKINLKSMLINTYYEKKNNNRTQKNSKGNNNKGKENKMNNNSAIVNYSNNLKSDNKKINNKNFFNKNNENIKLKTELYNHLYGDKIKHKKIKSMRDTILNIRNKKNLKKFSNQLKYLSLENSNLNNNTLGFYLCNNINDQNLNTINYMHNNTNLNSIESNHHYQMTNVNDIKDNKLFKILKKNLATILK